MSELNWKVGDWAIFDLNIVQITEIRESGSCSVSDGSFETSGRLLGRLRPLTLHGKRAMEWFEYYYRELRKLRGESGFNYPDISQHFADLCLQAIDDENDKSPFDKGQEFFQKARDLTPLIQGIQLFRAGRER
jgi:hypothetical protein